MSAPTLVTKLFIPPPQRDTVSHRLLKQLNEEWLRKLTLICAPAGSGKTTLVSEWITGGTHPIVWLSLDEADNVPSRFLVYFVTALHMISPLSWTITT